ncbi:PP2C family serine/threonine-protein phosphatase [Pseudomonas sp. NBRC 111130]|uniref:PP2C family serine/threonine-protein phosphatase n=1 Tax=Pseudomonas sp. NBRC 111130 TaxID=1661045 RepID=UPI0006D4077E|nr:PP2C family serine/threonine-protein phosphatase [Pseudomonas sp. NBRC 111130]
MGRGLTWEHASAAVVGTSHLERNGVCEDRCSAAITLQGVRPWLSMFVADGAGSASFADVGAQLAVDTANEVISTLMQQPEFALDDSLAVELVKQIREVIYSRAEGSGHAARDYACTFLGLVSSELGTLVLQIGDGGIVFDVGNGLELAFQPMSGEYANMTHFVTDPDALDTLVTKQFQSIILRAAAFSDGLQHLAIDLPTGSPHEPFFQPFFNVLGTLKPDARKQMSSALAAFLGSEKVNERTDDDKSIALAVLRG